MNYFSAIEEAFCRRRGRGLVISSTDWALIETWKDAGIPLEAVLRGIENTFNKYDRRPNKTRTIHSLSYCAQEVLAAAELMKEAAVGSAPGDRYDDSRAGMEPESIARYLTRNAQALRQVNIAPAVAAVAQECALSLEEMASTMAEPIKMEDMERRLTVMEDKLQAALVMAAPESGLASLRDAANAEIAPYRSKMPSAQVERLVGQFINKCLFIQAGIPRLSLFYL